MPTSATQPDTFSHFDLAAMSKADGYKLLASVILPRPIAWVVSRDTAGSLNAAPFSFFNILSSDPPAVAIGFSPAPDRDGKDSLTNILGHGQFVINLVSEELATAMNITATNAPRGTDETHLAGLELAASTLIDVPRIVASPVALECNFLQTLNLGGSSTILFAKIVYIHVRTSAFEDVERLHIDPSQMHLIGRMHGGGGYCTTRDTFTIDRIPWPLEK
jgi:flavin reductase (DIM6/NTAB) family NADH-FMN oxidoreductase RutF